MTQLELEAEAKRLFECAKIDLKQHGEIKTVVLADCPELPQRIAIPLPWSNPEEKALLSAKVIAFLKQQHCTAYFLIAEVWSATVDPNSNPTSDKQSALLVHAETFDGHSYGILGTILNNEVTILASDKGFCQMNNLLDVFGGNNAVH